MRTDGDIRADTLVAPYIPDAATVRSANEIILRIISLQALRHQMISPAGVGCKPWLAGALEHGAAIVRQHAIYISLFNMKT